MEPGRSRPRCSRTASRRLWRAARSFDELCELGARFVAGDLASFPGWGHACLDLESEDLAPLLAALNRSGLLTLCSQPGLREPVRALEQRAFVSGFASDRAVRAVSAYAFAAGIRACVQRPGEPPRGEVALTSVAGVPRVVTGHDPFPAELACFEDLIRPELLAELAHRPFLTLWDERWGRNDALWTGLANCLVGPVDPALVGPAPRES